MLTLAFAVTNPPLTRPLPLAVKQNRRAHSPQLPSFVCTLKTGVKTVGRQNCCLSLTGPGHGIAAVTLVRRGY